MTSICHCCQQPLVPPGLNNCLRCQQPLNMSKQQIPLSSKQPWGCLQMSWNIYPSFITRTAWKGKWKTFFSFFFFRGETLKEARWSRHYHKSWVWSGERVKSQALLWDIQPHRSLCQLFLLYFHQFRTGCIKQVLTSALRQLNMLRFHLRRLKLLDRSQYLCFPFC